jgi:hypothetical protein
MMKRSGVALMRRKVEREEKLDGEAWCKEQNGRTLGCDRVFGEKKKLDEG